MDTTGGTKMQGALKVVLRSDSDTDILEDEEEADIHKQRKLEHPVSRRQPITVEIRGEYPWRNGFEEVVFAKDSRK
jgi:hypothetical protein